MKNTTLLELSDDELRAERKKLTSSRTFNAVLCGCLIGIAIYHTVRDGLGFFTFFPLYFAFIALNNRKKIKALDAEIQLRNIESH